MKAAAEINPLARDKIVSFSAARIKVCGVFVLIGVYAHEHSLPVDFSFDYALPVRKMGIAKITVTKRPALPL